MNIQKSIFWLVILVLGLSATAQATLIKYELGAVLQATGADAYDFDGADFLAVYEFDTAAQTPTTVLSGSGFVNSEYTPSFAGVTISNRPNAQMDVSGSFESLTDKFRVVNFFPPQTNNDRFIIDGGSLTIDATEFVFDGSVMEFGNQDFFPGSGQTALPTSLAGGALSLGPGIWNFTHNSKLYTLTNAQFSVTQATVPEPATLLLLGIGLLGVLVGQRDKFRKSIISV